MGFAREVDVLGQASRMGLFTKAFCTTADEALAMAEAGVDNIIVHFGNSSGGTVGSKTVLATSRAGARGRHPRCAGGEIRRPDRDLSRRRDRDARRCRALPAGRAAAHGYVGGSSAERFPIETSVVEVTRAFRSIRRCRGPDGSGWWTLKDMGSPRWRSQATRGQAVTRDAVSRRSRHARQQARGGALRVRALRRRASRRGWSTSRCGRTAKTSPMSAGRTVAAASGTTWEALATAVARRGGADHDPRRQRGRRSPSAAGASPACSASAAPTARPWRAPSCGRCRWRFPRRW